MRNLEDYSQSSSKINESTDIYALRSDIKDMKLKIKSITTDWETFPMKKLKPEIDDKLSKLDLRTLELLDRIEALEVEDKQLEENQSSDEQFNSDQSEEEV
jgi:hypothetical protein